jgi:hypothetical protein
VRLRAKRRHGQSPHVIAAVETEGFGTYNIAFVGEQIAVRRRRGLKPRLHVLCEVLRFHVTSVRVLVRRILRAVQRAQHDIRSVANGVDVNIVRTADSVTLVNHFAIACRFADSVIKARVTRTGEWFLAAKKAPEQTSLFIETVAFEPIHGVAQHR